LYVVDSTKIVTKNRLSENYGRSMTDPGAMRIRTQRVSAAGATDFAVMTYHEIRASSAERCKSATDKNDSEFSVLGLPTVVNVTADERLIIDVINHDSVVGVRS
jgi:hypothetical protein